MQSLKLQEARDKASAAIANGAMAAYGERVQRALRAAEALLAVGDELAELNAALRAQGVSSFDGCQRRLVGLPVLPAEARTWLKQVRSMWSK